MYAALAPHCAAFSASVVAHVALVGDASGSVDPLTGEGIGLGLKQAAALVEAIKRDDLQRYQAAHDRIGRVPRLMSRLMLLMDAHPHLRRRALQAFAAEPSSLFSRLLDVQVGETGAFEMRYGLGPAIGMASGSIPPINP